MNKKAQERAADLRAERLAHVHITLHRIDENGFLATETRELNKHQAEALRAFLLNLSRGVPA